MDKALIESRKQELRDLPPNTKIYCHLENCSSNGMSRRIKIHYIKDNEHCFIHIDDSKNFERMYKMRGNSYPEFAVYVVGGCGMDMGFDLVYRLGSYIWRDHEKELVEKCLKYQKENPEAYELHKSLTSERVYGGYYFKHVWL